MHGLQSASHIGLRKGRTPRWSASRMQAGGGQESPDLLPDLIEGWHTEGWLRLQRRRRAVVSTVPPHTPLLLNKKDVEHCAKQHLCLHITWRLRQPSARPLNALATVPWLLAALPPVAHLHARHNSSGKCIPFHQLRGSRAGGVDIALFSHRDFIRCAKRAA